MQDETTANTEAVFGGEIPGAEYLGWGFNVFGTYDSRSALNRLLALPTSDRTFEDGGVSYLVPDDVTVKPERKSLGETRAFSSRSKVEGHFSAQAGIEASYGAFKGQFEASYSHISESDRKYMYALHRAGRRSWWLDIDNPSQENLARAVLSDPVYRDLPETYEEENQWRFFAFFEKYGTHFVRKVEAGFHVYMTTWVLKEYSKNETEITAKMKLQYEAVFGVKAHAAARWHELGEDWSTASGTRIEAVGGDASLLEAVAVSRGENFEDVYKRWLVGAESAPVGIGFQLEPVWHLFTPEKAKALEKAFAAYVRNRIYVESKTLASLIMVRGEPVDAGERPDPRKHSGFQVAILDQKTLKPVVSQYVALRIDGFYSPDWQRAFNELAALLVEHGREDRLVILAGWGLRANWYPTEKLYEQLVSIGAGSGLGVWFETSKKSASSSLVGANYVLVGVPRIGFGAGLETIEVGHYPNMEAEMAVLDIPIQRAPGEVADASGLFQPTIGHRAA